MSGLLQGGPAVLFAVIIYGIFYALAGGQFRRVLVADESIGMRVFSSLAVIVVSAVIWMLVGAVVYWSILLWFRFLLQEPHAWRQQILDLTAWFPCGALFGIGAFPPGVGRVAEILLSYPAMLLLAAMLIACWQHIRGESVPTHRARGAMATTVFTATAQRTEERQ